MSIETVSKQEYDQVTRKLEVSKGFLREMDRRLSKYESLGIDELIDTLDGYQALGSIEDLTKLKTESGDMRKGNKPTLAGKLLSKVEQDEVAVKQLEDLVASEEEELKDQVDKDAPPDMNLAEKEKNEADTEGEKEESDESCDDSNDKSEDDSEEEEEDEDEDEEDEDDEVEEEEAPTEVKFEAAQKRLAVYKKLGSPSELRSLMRKMESLLSSHVVLNEKLESYLEIGTVPELIDVCTDYAKIKTKEEAARISTALKIPVEDVVSTIEKTETVADAEKLLRTLFLKGEGEKTPSLSTKQKSESAEQVERASIVDDKAKDKSEAANIENLAKLIKKL